MGWEILKNKKMKGSKIIVVLKAWSIKTLFKMWKNTHTHTHFSRCGKKWLRESMQSTKSPCKNIKKLLESSHFFPHFLLLLLSSILPPTICMATNHFMNTKCKNVSIKHVLKHNETHKHVHMFTLSKAFSYSGPHSTVHGLGTRNPSNCYACG